MKKRYHKFVLLATLFGWFTGMGGQVVAATATGTATANVVQSLSIGTTAPTGTPSLTFGTFASSAAGTIELDPSTCSAASSVSHFGGQACAKFSISGYENAAYIVNYDSDQILTHMDGGSTATIPYALELDDGDNRNRNLNNGFDEIQFGGSLEILPDTPVGVYSGTFNVTIEYQ